jgi:hypothetical protein
MPGYTGLHVLEGIHAHPSLGAKDRAGVFALSMQFYP